MNHYIDIHILPDPEFRATILMNAIFSKLHKALSDLGSTNIGVSFPKCKVTLGNTLRLHSARNYLLNLQVTSWLGGMSGYCSVSDVLLVPDSVQYRSVGRKHTTMSQSKLARLIKRGSIVGNDAKNYRAKMFAKELDNPYLELVSGSNGHRHRRYIEFGPLLDGPVEGSFDQFGLSKTATIPWF